MMRALMHTLCWLGLAAAVGLAPAAARAQAPSGDVIVVDYDIVN